MCMACVRVLLLQALKPHIFVSVPRLWNRIYDRVMATMREANPIKRRMFETAFAHKRAALEAGLCAFLLFLHTVLRSVACTGKRLHAVLCLSRHILC